MYRRDDWQSRLHFYLRDCMDRPFRYGDFDCGQFVVGAIEATTGYRIVLPAYSSRREALVAFRAISGSSSVLRAAQGYAAQLGAVESRNVLMAKRGNPVWLRKGAFGIVGLSGEVLTPSKRGLTTFTLDASCISRYWGI